MSHKLTGPSKLLFGFFFGLILGGSVLVYADAFDVNTATIPYTGWVDNNGVPVNNTLTKMNFAFYLEANCSGDPTWKATNDWPQQGVDVTPYHGRFSVELGATGQNNLTKDLFNNAVIYLQIAIAGTKLTGCQKIVPSRMASSSQRSDNFTVTTLNVTENTNLKATTVGGTLNVTGNTTLKKTTVAGDLVKSSGNTTLNKLNVTGGTNLKSTTIDGALTTTNGDIFTKNIQIRSSGNDPDNSSGILAMNGASTLWSDSGTYIHDGSGIQRKHLEINREYGHSTRNHFRDVSIKGKTVSFPNGKLKIGDQTLGAFIKQEARSYVRANCYMYFGWKDSSNDDAANPEKIIRVMADGSSRIDSDGDTIDSTKYFGNDFKYSDGSGRKAPHGDARNTFVQTPATKIRLGSFTLDGNVDGNDRLYIGFHCE